MECAKRAEIPDSEQATVSLKSILVKNALFRALHF